MRAPVEWLSQYCGGRLSTPELEERLTMTGTKVEAVLTSQPGVISPEGMLWWTSQFLALA